MTKLIVTPQEKVTVEVLQSYDGKYTALGIDGKRFGPDAGPWQTELSFKVDRSELIKLIAGDYLDSLRERIDVLIKRDASNERRIDRLQQWVDDLQAGLFVNCVYCGYRYGPRSDTPVSMADILKQHIEHCPEHPLFEVREALTDLVELKRYIDARKGDKDEHYLTAKPEAWRRARRALDIKDCADCNDYPCCCQTVGW